jgi:hypothetical protein
MGLEDDREARNERGITEGSLRAMKQVPWIGTTRAAGAMLVGTLRDARDRDAAQVGR